MKQQHSPPPFPYALGSASRRGVVIGVLGATGGLGASTLAAILAVRGGLAGHSTLLVDGHPFGGGLDILLGLDASPALRWPDLSSAQGDLDGAAILSALPAISGCHVVSWGRAPGGSFATAAAVCAALVAEADLSVIDLPGPGTPDAQRWSDLCDHLVLLCGSGVRQLVTAAVVLETVELADRAPGAPRVVGLLRQAHRGAPDVDSASALLGIPLWGKVETDRRIEVALRRGEAIGLRTGPLTQLCERILRDLSPVEGAAA